MAGDNPLDYLYPLDTTGKAASNRVPNERQTLNPPEEPLDYHFVIPKAGPFYRNSVVLTHIPTGRVLVRGADWAPGHKFHSASYELQGVEGGLYLSILFYDRTLSGEIKIDYQNLGGEWTLSENKILEILSNRAVDPRSVTYEEVSGKPEVFPPVDHNHPVDDMTGFRELIQATYDVAAAIRARTDDWLENPPIIIGDWYNKDEVDALIAALEDTNSDALRQLAQQLQQLQNDYLALKARVDGHDTAIGAINTTLSTHTGQIAAITTVNNQQATDITALQQRCSALEATTTSLQTQITQLNTNLTNTINSVNSNLQGQINTLSSNKLDRNATAVNSALLEGNNTAAILAAAYNQIGSNGKRNLYVSGADPTGGDGAIGDVWFKV